MNYTHIAIKLSGHTVLKPDDRRLTAISIYFTNYVLKGKLEIFKLTLL